MLNDLCTQQTSQLIVQVPSYLSFQTGDAPSLKFKGLWGEFGLAKIPYHAQYVKVLQFFLLGGSKSIF